MGTAIAWAVTSRLPELRPAPPAGVRVGDRHGLGGAVRHRLPPRVVLRRQAPVAADEAGHGDERHGQQRHQREGDDEPAAQRTDRVSGHGRPPAGSRPR